MSKRKTRLPAQREPTNREAEHGRRAADLLQIRAQRTEVVWCGDAVISPHADQHGHHAALMAAFGTSSSDFMAVQLATLERSCRARGSQLGENVAGLNAGLAFVEAVQPTNEIEAALAVQMAGIHSLTSELLGRARLSGSVEQLAVYAGLAVKLSRTFADQLEILSRLRGNNQQRVEVRHVHVSGNAVIGDIHPGGGGDIEHQRQPLAPCPAPPASPALPGPIEAVRHALPRASVAGKSPLPHARRR
jgi:hypothetical protein